ncbi:MAG: (Fe-S)-binding protein [Desulfurococcales archaeon]|nr:(Fe-S)-binding protein [Desulfurococcales archaeon]
MLDIGTVLALLRDNIRKTGLPVPVGKEVLWEWSKGLDLPREGEVLLYTGALYQLLPYISVFARQLARMEKSGAGRLAFKAFGKLGGRLGGLAGLVLKPSKVDIEYSHSILRSVVELLKAAGVSVAYDPGVDGYSGVLLYDMGLDDDFRAHAEGEARRLVESGARVIVTVDPHTTHTLRSVYPKLFPWFELEVRSYLEILAENVDKLGWKSGDAGAVTIHDPCFYARSEGIIGEPRTLLERAGYRVVNPRRWGRMTYCCGGPVESISPGLAGRIAEKRIEELHSTGAPVVAVMCPICLSNLRGHSRGKLRVEDISILLRERLEA